MVRRSLRVWRTTAVAAGALAATLLAAAAGAAEPTAWCSAPGPDPFFVPLYPTAHANFASGAVELRFAESPFGVTVTENGHHLYEAELVTRSLPRDGRALVVWAATPNLDQVARLGTIGEDGRLSARIAFNKFLVFVTAEASADVERWSGPILLRGISPSGRMHTMAGHGPFQGEPCSAWGFGPGAPPDLPPRR